MLVLPVLWAGVPAATAAVAQGKAPRAVASDPGLGRLEAEIRRLAEAAGGVVGVGAIHLETGRSVFLNPDERFHTASTRKFPIAVELLSQVERGMLRLDSLIYLEPDDMHPGSGIINNLLNDPGVALSLRNLMDLMLQVSDGAATSLVLEAIGGPEVVSAKMGSLGLEEIYLGRNTLQILADFYGVQSLPAPGPRFLERFQALAAAVPKERRLAAEEAYYRDRRESTTPAAMAELLARLWRGELLSPENTRLLLEVMYGCQSSPNRLKGLLPPGTRVARKDGTIGKVTNDVGVIDLPDGAGHVVAAVYVKDSVLPVPERERAIAMIARALYDYFHFNPGS
ncbi:MAG: serine hydrolase [Gemmatimonadetes bacterium]|nr:serine hydrolase [Gemmatimonadota bacterium]